MGIHQLLFSWILPWLNVCIDVGFTHGFSIHGNFHPPGLMIYQWWLRPT